MDSRAARRAAEKAARDLVNARAAHVGDLAVAHAEHTALQAAVTQAQQRGQQLVADAQREAERLIAQAQQDADAAQQRYADSHARALAAGWQNADLDELGYRTTAPTPAPSAVASGRRRLGSLPKPSKAPSAPQAPAPTEVSPVVPAQHDGHDLAAGAQWLAGDGHAAPTQHGHPGR